MAVTLGAGGNPGRADITISEATWKLLRDKAAQLTDTQRYVRGIFSGDTFCFEAQLLHRAAGIAAHSNTPVEGNIVLADIATSVENTIVDMGDAEFTQGRPHPMIDPSLRDNRIRTEATDPTTAVVLFDVVLGCGSALDPIAGLLPVLTAAHDTNVVFIGYVCGTDLDPQDRDQVVARLESAGVLVAASNAEAATWSAALIAERTGAIA